jgi:molybdopterin synthase sulfur carrier subunit
MPRVRVLYFALVREKIGLAEEEVELPPDVGDVAGLRLLLAQTRPILAQASVRAAVNQCFAQPYTPVGAGDEVAFFPPTTGG